MRKEIYGVCENYSFTYAIVSQQSRNRRITFLAGTPGQSPQRKIAEHKPE